MNYSNNRIDAPAKFRRTYNWPAVNSELSRIVLRYRFRCGFRLTQAEISTAEGDRNKSDGSTRCVHTQVIIVLEPHCSRIDHLGNIIRKPLFHSPLLCKMSIADRFPARFAPFAMG